MSKRFNWEEPIVTPKPISDFTDMKSRIESPRPTETSPPDIKKLRTEVKELHNKSKQGAKK